MDQVRRQSRAAAIGAVVLLLAMFGAVLSVGILIWNFVIGLRAEQSGALVAAGVAGVISLFGVYVTRRADRARDIESSLRPRKAEVYEEFMRFWIGTLLGVREGKPVKVGDDDFKNFFATFTQKLIVWGSNEVIREYRNFRRVSFQKPSSVEMMLQFERLLFAIRKDLGHTNQELVRGDVLGLFVNDMDDVLKAAGAQPGRSSSK